MRFLLFPCLLLLLLLSVSCFIIGPAPTPTPVRLSSLNPLEDPAGPAASRAMPIPLTREATELRRIRDEHAALIASIPPTMDPTPTLTVVERSLVASARVRRYPDGAPVPPQVGEDWFDPGVGLDFYRDSGDDWTSRAVRESHPHRDLFYFSEYPDSIPNFFDRSIYHYLSRELVFESVVLRPFWESRLRRWSIRFPEIWAGNCGTPRSRWSTCGPPSPSDGRGGSTPTRWAV